METVSESIVPESIRVITYLFAGEAVANSFNGYSSGGILSLASDIG